MMLLVVVRQSMVAMLRARVDDSVWGLASAPGDETKLFLPFPKAKP
jgi:hypothetical protein